MTCTPIKIPGGVAIVCGPRGKRPPRCCRCNEPASLLCDAVVGKSDRGVAVVNVTCDAPICELCTTKDSSGRKDFCPRHKPKGGPTP